MKDNLLDRHARVQPLEGGCPGSDGRGQNQRSIGYEKSVKPVPQRACARGVIKGKMGYKITFSLLRVYKKMKLVLDDTDLVWYDIIA